MGRLCQVRCSCPRGCHRAPTQPWPWPLGAQPRAAPVLGGDPSSRYRFASDPLHGRPPPHCRARGEKHTFKALLGSSFLPGSPSASFNFRGSHLGELGLGTVNWCGQVGPHVGDKAGLGSRTLSPPLSCAGMCLKSHKTGLCTLVCTPPCAHSPQRELGGDGAGGGVWSAAPALCPPFLSPWLCSEGAEVDPSAGTVHGSWW